MRKEYEMTEQELQNLLDIMHEPVPYIIIGGVPPRSPQDRANAAWATLARQYGFDVWTVASVPGKGPRFFTAEELSHE